MNINGKVEWTTKEKYKGKKKEEDQKWTAKKRQIINFLDGATQRAGVDGGDGVYE